MNLSTTLPSFAAMANSGMSVGAGRKGSKVVKLKKDPTYTCTRWEQSSINTTLQPALGQSAGGVLSSLDYNVTISANVASSMASHTVKVHELTNSPYKNWVIDHCSNHNQPQHQGLFWLTVDTTPVPCQTKGPSTPKCTQWGCVQNPM